MISFEIDNDTKILLGFLVVVIAGFFCIQSYTKSNFKEICDKSNGTTVWDGRQYQCLNGTPVTVQSK